MGWVIGGNQPAYEVVSNREERDDEIEAEKTMQVIEVSLTKFDLTDKPTKLRLKQTSAKSDSVVWLTPKECCLS
ncbi:MAG: hypothetical protein WAU15_06725, partial [Nitrosomonas sp.]